jgi:aspartyl-tRNA(Asn)/glutamyl-tRNA(Gln) amidotransferase subunit A
MDTALLLEIMAGPDPMDATCIDAPVPRYHEELKGDVEGLRLGIPKEYFVEGLDPEVKEAVEGSIKTLEGLGARAAEISLPHTDYAIATYYVLCTAEASSNLARYDGVVYSSRKPGKDLVEMYMNTRREGFGDEVIRRIMLGTYVLSAGFYDAYYLKGQRVRTLICRDFDAAFETCDVILTPTSPTAAWKKGEKADDPLQMYLSDVFTTPSSLAGVPGISIPCGFTKDGLPIGLQIIGKVLDETTVLRTAWAFEQATDHHTRKAPLENGS